MRDDLQVVKVEFSLTVCFRQPGRNGLGLDSEKPLSPADFFSCEKDTTHSEQEKTLYVTGRRSGMFHRGECQFDREKPRRERENGGKVFDHPVFGRQDFKIEIPMNGIPHQAKGTGKKRQPPHLIINGIRFGCFHRLNAIVLLENDLILLSCEIQENQETDPFINCARRWVLISSE